MEPPQAQSIDTSTKDFQMEGDEQDKAINEWYIFIFSWVLISLRTYYIVFFFLFFFFVSFYHFSFLGFYDFILLFYFLFLDAVVLVVMIAPRAAWITCAVFSSTMIN